MCLLLGGFGPGWVDVEQVEDASLGGGEAVELEAVGGVGGAESLEGGEDVAAGGAGGAAFGEQSGELLVVVADIIGVFGGYIVGIYKLGFGPYEYINSTFEFLETQDVVSGLVKAAVFGFLVALMGCYQGYNSRGGAQGVGAATTKAVVSASILILTANYVVTELFFSR